MSFDNDTNHKRVQKILDTLDLIEKSAKSNKAAPEEVTKLLSSVAERVSTPTEKPKGGTLQTYKSPPGSLSHMIEDLNSEQLCTLISLAAIQLEKEL